MIGERRIPAPEILNHIYTKMFTIRLCLSLKAWKGKFERPLSVSVLEIVVSLTVERVIPCCTTRSQGRYFSGIQSVLFVYPTYDTLFDYVNPRSNISVD